MRSSTTSSGSSTQVRLCLAACFEAGEKARLCALAAYVESASKKIILQLLDKQTCFCQTFRKSHFGVLPDVVLPKIA